MPLILNIEVLLDFCEDCDEPFGFIKGREFLN